VLKQLFIDSGYFTVSPSTFFMTGALAGLCAQSVVYPLDVIRRRIQMDTVTIAPVQPGSGAGVRLYTWLAMKSVVEKEGMRSLFAGILPTMLKVAPAVSISVVTRDAILGKLG
jgi:solute carrier family 25 phosphate transporter 23/24/25/41